MKMGEEEDQSTNIIGAIVSGLAVFLSYVLCIGTFPLSLVFIMKQVNDYERAVIFRLGRLLQGGAKGPGMFVVLPCIDEYRKVELRTTTYDIPRQEILTKDSVTVAVDAVMYYKICDPVISVVKIMDVHSATRLLSQTTLRNELGTRTLAEVLTDREKIAASMQVELDAATDKWGVKVERIEIKDVRLPMELQRAMAAEAEATREAGAKIIAAQGEKDASVKLKEAAEVMSGTAMQLRYLQTLNTISADKNNTVVFPLPVDLMKKIMK